MGFVLEQFLKLNLIQGFQNGSFNENQVSIFSMNYFNKGQISEAIFAEIQGEIVAIKEEWEEAIKNPPVIEPEPEIPEVDEGEAGVNQPEEAETEEQITEEEHQWEPTEKQAL